MLEVTTGVIKLLRAEYCVQVSISIVWTVIALFTVVYRFIVHKRAIGEHF